jgi:hypothetical protein
MPVAGDERAATTTAAGTLLIEQDDEWIVRAASLRWIGGPQLDVGGELVQDPHGPAQAVAAVRAAQLAARCDGVPAPQLAVRRDLEHLELSR